MLHVVPERGTHVEESNFSDPGQENVISSLPCLALRFAALRFVAFRCVTLIIIIIIIIIMFISYIAQSNMQ